MYCPKCNSKMTCTDSREENNVRWRTYACTKCKAVIGTSERVEDYHTAYYKARAISAVQESKRGRVRKKRAVG